MSVSSKRNSKKIDFLTKNKEIFISKRCDDKDASISAKNRKYSLNYNNINLAKLKKKVNSSSDYFENNNYTMLAEDFLEKLEILKKRKMSI